MDWIVPLTVLAVVIGLCLLIFKAAMATGTAISFKGLRGRLHDLTQEVEARHGEAEAKLEAVRAVADARTVRNALEMAQGHLGDLSKQLVKVKSERDDLQAQLDVANETAWEKSGR